MSVVDFLLNSLIKKLKKTQKARKRRKAKKRKAKTHSRRRIPKKKKIKRRSSRPAKKQSIFKKRHQRKPKKSAIKGKKRSGAPHKIKTVTAKKAAVKPAQAAVKEACVGEITHFFPRIQVVVVKMTGGRLNVGETIHIVGKATDFTQKVGSLQIESVDVRTARKGQLVGLKVNKVAKAGSKVYKRTG